MASRSDHERFPELYTTDHVDRRGMKRVVPMEVLVLGMCRTGTSSIWEALHQLGYDDVYHMISVASNPPDARLWREAVDAKFYGIGKPYEKEEWDALLGHCMAVTDFPCAAFAPELIAAYPAAKVILTNRPVDPWFVSTANTIGSVLSSYPLYLISFIDPSFLRPWLAMVSRMWNATFDSNFAANGKRVYAEHYEKIRHLVPKEKLLEYEVGNDGWQPLCDFLGKEVPKGEFPKVNDTKAFGDRMKVIMKLKVRKALWAAMPWLAVVSSVGLGVVGLKKVTS